MAFSHAAFVLEVAVRGMKETSIRGLNPETFEPSKDYVEEDLEEVTSVKAAELRSLWMMPKPKGGMTRLERAIESANKKGKPRGAELACEQSEGKDVKGSEKGADAVIKATMTKGEYRLLETFYRQKEKSLGDYYAF